MAGNHRGGSHAYFTKRAWNVLQVFERFVGSGRCGSRSVWWSGVTAVEALVLRRRAIHVDISEFANFIAWGIAVAPVDLAAFQREYVTPKSACSEAARLRSRSPMRGPLRVEPPAVCDYRGGVLVDVTALASCQGAQHLEGHVKCYVVPALMAPFACSMMMRELSAAFSWAFSRRRAASESPLGGGRR